MTATFVDRVLGALGEYGEWTLRPNQPPEYETTAADDQLLRCRSSVRVEDADVDVATAFGIRVDGSTRLYTAGLAWCAESVLLASVKPQPAQSTSKITSSSSARSH